MATYCTAKFSFTNTAGRRGGFSESIWNSSDSIPNCRGFLQSLMAARLALSSNAVRLIESTFITNQNPPQQQVFVENFQGQQSSPTDTPWNGIRYYLATASGQRRVYRVTAVADAFMVGGVNVVPITLENNLRAAFLANGWSIRGRDRTVTPRPLISVDAVGNYLLQNDGNYVEGNRVRLRRGRDSFGQRLTGDFTVTDPVGARAGRLQGWPPGRVLASGELVLRANPTVAPITESSAGGPIVRKIGRPLLVYSGRQSRR